MKKAFSLLLTVTLVIGLLFSTSAGVVAGTETLLSEQYLVMFQETTGKANLQSYGIEASDILYEFQLLPVYLMKLSQKQVAGLSSHPDIKAIEKDVEVKVSAQTIPWGLPHVQATQAHSQSITGSGVKVAILDTGIDRNHQDLSANVKGGYSVFTDSANSNPYYDGSGHGTHVAGTVAAVNNTLGVLGVAYNANLYAVKVLNNSGSGSYSGIAQGIEWSILNNMDIINMSLGGPTYSSILEQYCNLAYNNYGILVVAAAGNSGNSAGTGDNVGYPARFGSVIAVAAVDKNNYRAYFSSTGSSLELSAPGVDILSTTPNNGYASYNGTSMASPHVAGVAALVWSKKTNLSNVQLRTLLRNTAVNIGTHNHYGYGLVQAMNAINN